MASLFRRLLGRSLEPFDRRFEHADRRILDAVETVVRHTDQRLGEASAQVDRRHHDTVEALAQLRHDLDRTREEIDVVHRTMIESTAYMGRTLRSLSSERGAPDDGLLLHIESLRKDVEAALAEMALRPNAVTGDLVGATLDELDGNSAAFIDFATGHQGFAAQAGVWLNPAVRYTHGAHQVEVAGVNERIVEIPYAVQALSRLPAGSSLLDLGGSESTLALSLAALGFEITVVDPRPYPFRHPSLTAVLCRLEEWRAEPESFDGLLAISSVEHFGLAVYGQVPGPEDADVQAMVRLRRLARRGATLVITVPYGPPGCDGFQRVYDKAALEHLLAGWHIEDWTIAEQLDERSWSVSSWDGVDDDRRRVAMLTATRL